MEEKLNRRPHRMELENRGAGRITGHPGRGLLR